MNLVLLHDFTAWQFWVLWLLVPDRQMWRCGAVSSAGSLLHGHGIDQLGLRGSDLIDPLGAQHLPFL